jgi:tetratricopeptide (TPR) repeat protein
VTGGSYLAFYNLGCYAAQDGNYDEAIEFYKEALNAEPGNAIWTDYSQAYNDLGLAYLQKRDIADAVSSIDKAISIHPDFPKAYYNLGCAFLENNQPAEAIDCLQRARTMDLASADIHYKLANALMRSGQFAKAIAEFDETLRLRPGMAEAANNLAWLLATCKDRSLRDGARAVALARQAIQQSHDLNPRMLGTLAAAYAQAGQFSDAVSAAQQAKQMALEQHDAALAAALESQFQEYQAAIQNTRR